MSQGHSISQRRGENRIWAAPPAYPGEKGARKWQMPEGRLGSAESQTISTLTQNTVNINIPPTHEGRETHSITNRSMEIITSNRSPTKNRNTGFARSGAKESPERTRPTLLAVPASMSNRLLHWDWCLSAPTYQHVEIEVHG